MAVLHVGKLYKQFSRVWVAFLKGNISKPRNSPCNARIALHDFVRVQPFHSIDLPVVDPVVAFNVQLEPIHSTIEHSAACPMLPKEFIPTSVANVPVILCSEFYNFLTGKPIPTNSALYNLFYGFLIAVAIIGHSQIKLVPLVLVNKHS
ncbi:TPA: hypothetical protein ACIULA_003000, partial [Salmonella enterica subsp. enterica serovar Javiana]